MAWIFGWKDILRPIRDGYRHFFPSPDTGPLPEERERRRRLDRLKGFAYFDTFDQLDAWTEADADVIQRANIPLFPRSRTVNPGQVQKTSVLLCHDYSGNYHDYEAIQRVGIQEESYTCEYLQFVDTFVYFSHKLACIPPPSWTNTLHRNGVKALGTLLLEPQTQDLERLLKRDGIGVDGKIIFAMTIKLANIAKYYGFDGWLINIEKPFPNNSWDPQVLVDFLKQLRKDMGPSRELIWYDAITIDNKVAYQNALTEKNLPFAIAAGAILTNYCWKEVDAQRSKELTMKHELQPERVFTGIDIWAQNKTSLTHPRVTYPGKGGGGTNTGIAVDKLREIGLSAGIFGPAWTFEHFDGQSRAIDQAMWDGCLFSGDVTCSCGDTKTRHPPNSEYPITRSARQFPVGTETFFYTDFSRGFGRHGEQEAKCIYDGRTQHSQLASQSVLPHMFTTSLKDDSNSSINVLSKRLQDGIDKTSLVIEARSIVANPKHSGVRYRSWLPLFDIDMPDDGTLELFVSWQYLLQVPSACVSVYLRSTSGTTLLELSQKGDSRDLTRPLLTKDSDGSSRLQEIGLHLDSLHIAGDLIRIVELREMRIIPLATYTIRQNYILYDMRFERRGEGEQEHWRLAWKYRGSHPEGLKVWGMPHSEVTGSFSHFWVRIDGMSLGRVYAMECILPTPLIIELRGKEFRVEITGYGFDGQQLAYVDQVQHADASS